MSKEWEECRDIEAKSFHIIKAWLFKVSNGINITPNEARTGRKTMEVQEIIGDIIIKYPHENFVRYVELKAETKYTGKVFLEMWVNRNTLKQGWWQKTKAEHIFYHFLDSDVLVTLELDELRAMDLSGYSERRMKKRNAPGDVWGLIVPIADIQKHCKVKIIHPYLEISQDLDVPLQVPAS